MKYLLIFQFLINFVIGNTESFLLHVSNEFPSISSRQLDYSNVTTLSSPIDYISLKNVNIAKKVINTNISASDPNYIELLHLSKDETYQIKICWSAIHPISIDDMDWFIVPHSTLFQDTISDEARIFITFNTNNDSYPVMNDNQLVPINVSIINVKLGIPVDLYRVLVFIIVVLISIFILNQHFQIYYWIKNF
ncbi:hypothetical protein Kpol_1027p17 [Vanderwaltozyma polyspora DSM 70294]|uniref:Uncharacterized protein n=1 Tax=Vanderwaltozyma polyspora (strain ATCC 22028 / DSM 70294 / BCRC 21397 / CBS 2163 / NBRC 10782 / NRRL Y-8283 / UCD 57-17) TaxID=436907 RepID=A7TQM2_VANPO|nr:uncharacterized protein Kpol_1027p17 [Vanderwaltozyma polyspora DSM 70294]EDO15443.1 hypothetical protein Kpol_1027p17 [Vanderwaltozyma polyspora DSM 70294]